jgi:hypothetical protein
LPVAGGQQAGQGIVRAERVGGIALEALGDRDRGHLRGVQEVQRDRVTWPIAGTSGYYRPVPLPIPRREGLGHGGVARGECGRCAA